MYYNAEGVPENRAEAVKWWHKAAEQGFAVTQFNLGWMYDEGRGVPQNYAEAVKWYRKAAEQGHAIAQFSLGIMYAKGEGVPKDYVKTHMWWSLAKAQGHEKAAKGLDTVKKEMTPAQIAKAQELAIEMWKKYYN